MTAVFPGCFTLTPTCDRHSQMGYRKVLPDTAGLKLREGGPTTLGGVACDVWELDQKVLNATSQLIGTYLLYTDAATGLPVRYHMLGHNTLFGGSHNDGAASASPSHSHTLTRRAQAPAYVGCVSLRRWRVVQHQGARQLHTRNRSQSVEQLHCPQRVQPGVHQRLVSVPTAEPSHTARSRRQAGGGLWRVACGAAEYQVDYSEWKVGDVDKAQFHLPEPYTLEGCIENSKHPRGDAVKPWRNPRDDLVAFFPEAQAEVSMRLTPAALGSLWAVRCVRRRGHTD